MTQSISADQNKTRYVTVGGGLFKEAKDAHGGLFRDPIAEAKAEALEAVAVYLDKPRVVWYGHDGVTVLQKDGDLDTLTPLADWLRAQAASFRGGSHD